MHTIWKTDEKRPVVSRELNIVRIIDKLTQDGINLPHKSLSNFGSALRDRYTILFKLIPYY